jgi:hypothetical protein
MPLFTRRLVIRPLAAADAGDFVLAVDDRRAAVRESTV